ncbi:hypothetical protein C1645_590410 [Glomus cerebriforme]|uniref:Uncharacterized protein n=1 Tax=Glomus cerebriforme TaxID=658196 RepID=A0A397T9M1_9GLOM|nr:hypothetical protein C1645_590410 [Glomus cerebriforme]
MAYLVIDGQLDYRYMELYNTGFYLRDHFISSDKFTKYYFKFNNTIWSNENQLNYKSKYGGLGAVSMYFYRARPINEKCDEMPQFEIKQPILPTGKSTNDIKITSGFDTIFSPLGPMIPNMNYLQSMYGFPIGVLHLHYRSDSWFKNCNALIKSLNDIQYDNKLVLIKQEIRDETVKQEPQYVGLVTIKQEVENKSLVILNQEPDQDIGIFSIKQENENSLNYPVNHIFENIKQEIKEEPNALIKVEPVETSNIITDVKPHKKNISKSNDFEIHKKNNDGRKIKKKSNANLIRKKLCEQIKNLQIYTK